MKFSDLTSNGRSMLAALCATGTAGLRTDALGNCATPKLSGSAAATVLLRLRELGLVFSNQKADSQSYALWKASEYGSAVFMGRPEDVPAVPVSGKAVCDGHSSYAQPVYASQRPAGSGERKYILRAGRTEQTFVCTQAHILAYAQAEATKNPGTDFEVFEHLASAHMPVPQAQIVLI